MIYAFQGVGFVVLGVLLFGAGYWAGSSDNQHAVDAAREQRDAMQREKWEVAYLYRQATAIARALWPE